MKQVKEVIGLTVKVTVYGKHQKTVAARIDTGATKSSIDIALARVLGVGPIIRKAVIRSAHGAEKRSIVRLKIRILNKKLKREFSLADRKHMKYKILIGVNVLKKGKFLIDPTL